ncbi:MAG TPA: hypothetical protein VF140_07825, partial [Phycicoccus sp.]
MTILQLLRHSLGRHRWTSVLLALVAALAAAYLVAAPRLASVAVDAALGDAVSAAPAQGREIGLRLTPRSVGAPTVSTRPGPGPQPPFERVDAAVREVMGPAVGRLVGTPSWAAQSAVLHVTRAGGAPVRPDGAQAVLRVQSGLDERVRWVSGAAPTAAAEERTIATPIGSHEVAVVPVALAARTAKEWGLTVGQQLDLDPLEQGAPAAAVLVGTFEPLDPEDGFWQVEPRMTGIASIPSPEGGSIEQAALVAGTEAYGAAADALWRTSRPDAGSAGSPAFVHSWRYPLVSERLTAADVAPLRALLTRLDSDARLRSAVPVPLHVTTGLTGILDGYERSVRTTGVMTSFAAAGVGALAVLVLGLTALVGVDRRRGEVRLLRARGASAGLVALLLAVEVALVVVPVGVVAGLLPVLLLPGDTPAATWVEAALVLAVPVGAAALGALARMRAVDRPVAADGDLTATVRAVRRLVLELAVLAVAVLAVLTVRSRGEAISAGTADEYAALAPVLVALAAALVVVRALPYPLGRLARVAGARRGLVGFVGLARAARTGATAVVPISAVVVGATVLGLLAATSVTIADQREVAAYRAVGADARVDAARLDPADLAALARRPGVGAVVPAFTDPAATLRTPAGTSTVLLVAVDPARYADLVRGTPADLGPLPAEPAEDRLPALTGPGVALDGDGELTFQGLTVPVVRAAAVPGLERVAAGRESQVVLVPLGALVDTVASVQPNTAFLAADPTAARALEATDPVASLTPTGLVTGVSTVRGTVERVSGLALPSLVAGTYVLTAVLAGLLSLLAVLLVLAATREERATLVIRLRTLGLPHGRDRALAWTEVLPVVAVAALAGGVVGALSPWLVAAALDLAPFTGAAVRPPVDPRPLVA